jgi:biotin carboxyl carrier protein
VTVEVAGRTRTVEVQRAGAGWLVTADGQRWTATLVPAGSHWSLLIGPADGPSRAPSTLPPYDGPFMSHELRFQPLGRDGLDVHVDGRAVPVTWESAGARRLRRGPGVERHPAETAIRAPMPGRVARVLVEPGQRVAAGQGLVVVEAMKMENELRAPAAGVVRDVRVAAGMPVEAEALLVVID